MYPEGLLHPAQAQLAANLMLSHGAEVRQIVWTFQGTIEIAVIACRAEDLSSGAAMARKARPILVEFI